MKIELEVFEPVGSNKEKEILKFMDSGMPMVFRIPQKMDEVIILAHGAKEGGVEANGYILNSEQIYRYLKAKVKNKLDGIKRVNLLCCYGYYQTATTIEGIEIIPLLPSKHEMKLFYGGRTIDNKVYIEISFQESIEEMERLIAIKEAFL